MKQFEDFMNSLTPEVMKNIIQTSTEKAIKKKEKDKQEHLMAFERYRNTYITLGLLEKYHEWTNQ